MSLTVRHLNGDSTFLLIFSPEPHPSPSDLLAANGAYSVLIDPWITGSSIVNAKWFAITERVEPSAISHLSEIEEPDVVICSQNKPDHTHKETLLQLQPEGKTIIAAEPGAAKAIKGWNHFDPHRVYPLVKYDARAKFGNSLRLHIAPLSPEGLPGEVNISFIPAKNYMTGLHNAIGITYQAPTRSKALATVTTIDLQRPKYFHLPMSPALGPDDTVRPLSPPFVYPSSPAMRSEETVVPIRFGAESPTQNRPRLSRSSNTASSELLSFVDKPQIQPFGRDSLGEHHTLGLSPLPEYQFESGIQEEPFAFAQLLPTPPDSPNTPAIPSTVDSPQSSHFTHKTSSSTLSSSCASNYRPLSSSNRPPTTHPARPKAVSVLYTPHGIALSDLKSYVQTHLVRLPGALPLTLLLHAFDHAQNPWYLGGNIMTGAAGGIAIAKALMARCWISAHDEAKDDRGVAVKLLKTERMTAETIRRTLASDGETKGQGWLCDVRSLDSGQEMLLSSNERDLLVGSNSEGIKQGLGIDDDISTHRAVTNLAG